MRVPVLEEVIFDQNNATVEALKNAIKTLNYGHSPMFIDLLNIDEKRTHIILDSITEILVDLKVHPIIPYPFYVISNTISDHELFCIKKAQDMLPSHFLNSTKKLKSKELSLLNKISILQEKFINMDIEDSLETLAVHMEEHKILYETTSELHFLETLNQKLQKT